MNRGQNRARAVRPGRYERARNEQATKAIIAQRGSSLLKNSPAQRSAVAIKRPRPNAGEFPIVWRAESALCGLSHSPQTERGGSLRVGGCRRTLCGLATAAPRGIYTESRTPLYVNSRPVCRLTYKNPRPPISLLSDHHTHPSAHLHRRRRHRPPFLLPPRNAQETTDHWRETANEFGHSIPEPRGRRLIFA